MAWVDEQAKTINPKPSNNMSHMKSLLYTNINTPTRKEYFSVYFAVHNCDEGDWTTRCWSKAYACTQGIYFICQAQGVDTASTVMLYTNMQDIATEHCIE